MEPFRKYQRDGQDSYTLGIFPTIELLKRRPELARRVLLHEKLEGEKAFALIWALCQKEHIACEVASRQVERLRDKENCLAVGLFRKESRKIGRERCHVVLVNPADSGNMGTILRTCAGFGINDLAVITPAVDVFHPKVVRSSMGAIFQMNLSFFPEFDAYHEAYATGRRLYPFLLDGALCLQDMAHPEGERFSLIFGNEASGLPPTFQTLGQSVCIRHRDAIDSLNLAVAVGIGVYEFTKGRRA